MDNMQFDTQQDEFGAPVQQKPGFDLSGKLIKWGLVSTRQEAEYVLIAVGVVALLAAFFFFRGVTKPSVAPPPFAETGSSVTLQ